MFQSFECVIAIVARFLNDEKEKMVAPTGFEPATSALRGRRPKPLDDGATISAALSADTRLVTCVCSKWLGWKESNPHVRHQKPLSCH